MDFSIVTNLDEVTQWLEKEFSGIRTGQASPALLDSVRVESYGTYMPISQVSSVGIEDARTLRISAWDANVIPAIEKAIRDADLGVSLATDSSGIRVIFPELTGERRAQLVKIAKSKLEAARVSVRGIRDEVMKKIDSAQKAGEISEDEKYTHKESVQKHVDATNQSLESLFAKKELEISR
jgi:ribosome recycling factor